MKNVNLLVDDHRFLFEVWYKHETSIKFQFILKNYIFLKKILIKTISYLINLNSKFLIKNNFFLSLHRDRPY